ncbi:MAG: SprB repeat-containing protein [Sphingobacteriales bacterium]|nr:MAG: SprB repeat-containing protein [Sphingobacteriales bacterium]
MLWRVNRAIDLSVLGGTMPYTYSWNTGAVSEDINGLGAGDYDVTVTDANGCTMGLSITLTEPAGMTLTETHTDVLCFGGLTGAIDLSVSGGLLPYTYIWNTGAVSEDINDLGAGDYDVTVTDANGCTMGLSITLTEPAGLTLTETHTDVLCFGGLTGAIDLSVSGGTVPYTYSWNTGAVSEDINGLGAGDYVVTVTDANGCTMGLSITLTEPAGLTLTETHIDVLCFGGLTGAIDLSVLGGTMPYTYSWNTGAVSEDINGLGAGDYDVTVTDANGCTMGLSITLTEPVGMTLTETHTEVLCFGGLTGAIDLSVSGGLLPYNYIWNTGAVSEDINGLGAGDYDVTVTDANGCTVGLSITLTEPVGMTLTETHTDVLCFGGLTGAIDLSVSGGLLPYNYIWNTGAVSEDINGLGAGDYDVTVTDANGCTMGLSITLTEPVGMTLTETHTDVLCFEGLTGAIDLSVLGGTMPYTYSWNTGAVSEDINGLGAGDYDVTVTDANGCSMGLSITLTEPVGMTLTETHTEVLCFGGLTGAIDLSVSGGLLPYNYIWNTGAVSEDINGLGAGDYDVTVTDANGCTVGLSITLTEPVGMTLTETHTDVLCFGGLTGAIDLSVLGGLLPYTYIWNTGAVSEDINGLGAGDYDVTVTDANGCTMGLSITLTEPAGMTLTETHTDVLCFGGLTGAIDLSVSGGLLPYTYIWNTGAVSEDLNGLGAGDYDVTVTDANGCSMGLSITLTEPAGMTLTETHTDVLCFGGLTGAIDLSVLGGTMPYTYSWNTGAVSEDINGLGAGDYDVTVTDANGCTMGLSITLTEPAGMTLTETHTDVLCFGELTGAIDLSVSGGTLPYTYNWNTGAVSEDINGLGAGDYDVTVTDANGCTMGLSITLTEPVGMTLTETHTDVLCFGGLTGAIDLSVSGGLLPYNYIWNTGAVSEDINGLGAGDYDVTVTDANGCTVGLSITLTEPAGMTLTETHTDVLCFGGLTGAIDLSVSGGLLPYNYIWNTGAVSEDINGLGAGDFDVTVTDANGCTMGLSITLTEPAGMTLTETHTDALCFGGLTGAIDLSVSSGTAPYTYSWNTGAASEDINGLGAGDYDVTVTDANGCTVGLSITLTEPAGMTLTETHTDVLCFGGLTGAIDLSVSGGLLPYNYIWNTGAVSEDINGLGAGILT